MKNTIYSPKGFQVASLHCCLKTEGRKYLALIVSESPCQLAAVFTTNKVKAAPVLFDQKIAQAGKDVRAVVINTGYANACTGSEGMGHNLCTGSPFGVACWQYCWRVVLCAGLVSSGACSAGSGGYDGCYLDAQMTRSLK